MSNLALWLALRIVRVVAILVPAVMRVDWTREWVAELQHQSAQLRRRRHPTWTTDLNLVGRALGALPDAAWIRRQFTLDAEAVHDVAHGIRLLAKTPAFTAIALLVFAIGIGATTAIVSVADALFMRRMVVPEPERVVVIRQRHRDTGASQDVAMGNAIDWIARARSFSVAAIAEAFSVRYGRDPGILPAVRVSDQFFSVLAPPMLHGRVFQPAEYRKGGERVAIFSYALWRDQFGGDPSIVGGAVRLNETESYTVVGVLPANLELRLYDTRSAQAEPLLWLPRQGIEPSDASNRAIGSVNVLARLAPGVSLDEARAELDAVSAQLAREHPQTNANITAQVVPLRAHLVGSLRQVLPLLIGSAAMLLIVACANVANLLLARGIGRSREFAVRQALGAGRGRLVRQMLVETLMVAFLGGFAGLLFARWILDVIARLRPLDVAGIDRIGVDVRAAAITCGVTVVAAVVAGLIPALQLSRPAASTALKESRTSSRRCARTTLVIVEVAAALVLAVGAGLLVRSFLLIQRVDPGFTRDHVSVMQVFASPRLDTPQKRIAFFHDALDRMRALPGVVAAGGVSAMPFGVAKVVRREPITIVGRSPAAGDEPQVQTTAVAGDYFLAMGVPLLQGRWFDATDSSASRHVVLVSQSTARTLWPGSDPVGSRVRFRFSGAPYDAEVIGVVGDVRHQTLDQPVAAELFVPYSQSGLYALTLVVRSEPGSPATLDALKEQIWSIDPRQSIYRSTTLQHLVSRTLVNRRFSLYLLGGFAAATVLLAAAGLYGVMSFATSQRTREFGLRMALGAAPRDIIGLVLRDGLRLAGLGVIVGLLVAPTLTRLLGTLLFGVTATDPLTFLLVSLGIGVVALLACFVPASRAMRADPVTSLRVD